jgi:hypothetical protein
MWQLAQVMETLRTCRVVTSWAVTALLWVLPLLSIICASSSWGFTGEACGRYPNDDEQLRLCLVELDLGGIDASRIGELRHGSGQDWYLEHADLQLETLWVDTQRLSESEVFQLATQCGQRSCRVRLTGIVHDHMISVTSFEVLRMPQ